MTTEVGFRCRCPHGCDEEAVGDDGARPICRRCVGGWHSNICDEFTTEEMNARLWAWRLGVMDTVCGRCGARKDQHASS